jgi:putative ABC transport system ATP-binding protein
MNPAIEARGVRRTYATGGVEYEALKGVDIKVERGEFVAIVGPSGSGKSTLLYLLGGLLRPTAGEVLVDGVTTSTMSDDDMSDMRNRHIGFIFQAFNLIPMLSVIDNVLLPARINGAKDSVVRPRAMQLLETVGIGGTGSRLPTQLSGGEQQRVAIARALVMQPSVILADEPTGNLDTTNGNAVMSLLCRLHDEGQTLVMVSHDLKLAALAGRIIEMRDGTIVREEAGAAPQPRPVAPDASASTVTEAAMAPPATRRSSRARPLRSAQ